MEDSRLPLIFKLQPMTRAHSSSMDCGNHRIFAGLIAVAELFFLFYQGLSAASYLLAPSSTHTTAASFQVLAVILATVAVVLLGVGVFLNKPALLVPHMVMQALTLFVLFAFGIGSLACMLLGTSMKVRMSFVSAEMASSLVSLPTASIPTNSIVSSLFSGILVLTFVFSIIACAIGVWSWFVVKNCYRQIQATEEQFKEPLSPMKSIPATDF